MKQLSRRLGIFVLAMSSLPAIANQWQVDHDNSKLAFVVIWDGVALEGIYRRFNANMIFDVNEPANSGFDVSIELLSAKTNNADVDEGISGSTWFDYKHHPLASFKTTEIRSLGEHRFAAQGVLTIKGISKPITMPFTWTQANSQAHMHGEVSVKRTDFNIGAGEWASDPSIDYDVKVIVDLRLKQGLPAAR
ncbi:MAG: polyisoprenoid-binding protein YceI [Gammaproteobacteria bacterium]|jgi:polyisoprenoid-binding protein YceI